MFSQSYFESIFNSAASNTPISFIMDTQSLTGVMSDISLEKQVSDYGYFPNASMVIHASKSQFTIKPEARKLITVDGNVYRVITVSSYYNNTYKLILEETNKK